MIVAAVLVAGGSGSRLGADVPKAFVRVAGATLLEHAIGRFAAHPQVRDVVTVLPAGHDASGTVVTGGATRQLSVAAGLAALAADVDLVLVHDVARPFVPDDVITAVVDALTAGAEAVVPVVPVTDTVRRVGADGVLRETVDRSTLAAVQTPQGFCLDVLRRAHDVAGDDATDDATDDAVLVEALGVPVVAVPGSDRAFKITTPADLVRAEAMVTRA